MKKNPIADIVREKRRGTGLTQAELAAKAGVGLRFIRDLEQGKSSLRTDTVNKVLFLFGKCLGAMDLPKEEVKPPLA
ncbi:MAG: helix-turn-helix transcriptional regulator [Elusimicrobia bacterium]|nr:helix-turn-helix transcriptional regulator [Elusimicrobiota bacterium]